MKRYFSLAIASLVFLGMSCFSSFAIAADNSVSSTSVSVITAADLGVENVGTLPTSRWYFLKEWKRGLLRIFTLDATAKAELELDITNEKAAEMISVEELAPKNTEALEKAFVNYMDGTERLRARIDNLEENSRNPNVEKLFKKLDEQTLKYSLLLNQIAERWNADPYVEDVNKVNPKAVKDNHLQSTVDILQKKIQEIAVAGAEKDQNKKGKAEDQIKRAEETVKELNSVTSKFSTVDVGISIQVSGKETLKRDFINKMFASSEMAAGMLANAKEAYTEGKFGEAFGIARSAEVLARNGLRILEGRENGVNKFPSSSAPVVDKDYEKKLKDIAACGPQMGAPGNWICKDEKWQLGDKTSSQVPGCGQIKCLRYDPICGTDGKTYGCGASDALSCGVKVAYPGKCTVSVGASRTIACTQEAKLCPDGSSVGRTGPNCEFAVCASQTPDKNVACTAQYDPVCGVNGKTYSNKCVATSVGIDVSYKGVCASASVETKSGTDGQSADVSIY